MVEVIDLSCPGCGVKVSTSAKKCEYCGNPIVITTFSSVNSMLPIELNKYAASYRKILAENPDNKAINGSIAMCYLKLKLYDKAIESFEKAVEENFDNSEMFFYAAVALLKGQKAFITPRANIDKIVEYLNAALMIEPKGIYHYFLAYIKCDYFERKFLNVSPAYQEELSNSVSIGVPETDIQSLFSLLGVELPAVLSI